MHKEYMLKCLDLAQRGFGKTKSNPMVGCLIVLEGQIIASGYHQEYGKAHAEVNAINSLADKSLIKSAVVYVNLEPCSHYGKTGPCADFLIENGVRKVVIACQDPNPKVAGQGIAKLRQAGVEVLTGVCEQWARFLNRRFFTFHEKQRPWIILKWAQTADAFIAAAESVTTQISCERSRELLHEFRSQEMSILVGTKTALIDNPYLTVRNLEGAENPTRILIDRNLKVPLKNNIFNDQAKTLVITEKRSQSYPENTELVQLKFDQDLEQNICKELWKRKIISCIIEGGAITLNNWINKNLFDEARVFVSPERLGAGVPAPVLDLSSASKVQSGSDSLYLLNNSKFINNT